MPLTYICDICQQTIPDRRIVNVRVRNISLMFHPECAPGVVEFAQSVQPEVAEELAKMPEQV